jgi:O-antigen/teichoic acid export membrane protein
MILTLRNLLGKIGIDGPIFFTLVTRVFQGLGGFITIFLIAHFMSKEEQGYYYTFASVLAIQIFFELGFGGIIVQFVAHEMSNLTVSSTNFFAGNRKSLSRLSSLLKFCIKWYAVFAALLFLCLLGVGYYFFSTYGSAKTAVDWQIPWLIVSLFTSLNLLVSPLIAILQGMNKVKEVAKIAMYQQLVVMFITWLSLYFGAKLYVVAINSAVSFFLLLFFYYRTSYPQLLMHLYKEKISDKINYKTEIFPLQWKIAISWISGYFIFQLFNPVVFAYEGAVVAGQIGMTLTFLNAILQLVVSWTSTKVPLWAGFIAKREYDSLNQSYNKVVKDSTLMAILFISIFFALIIIINYLDLPLADRFLPFWLCVILFVSVPFNNIINIWASYLRCFKKEPFLLQALVVGLLSALSTILGGKLWGVDGIVIGYTLVVVLISLPLSYYIFVTKKVYYYHG